MYRFPRTFMCLLLCVLLTGCAYGDAIQSNARAFLDRAEPSPCRIHADLHFSEIGFVMPDLAALSDRADRLLAACRGGEDARALQETLEALFAELEQAETMAALAYVHAALDETDPVWRQRRDTLAVGIDPIYETLVQAALLLSERRELRSFYDEETVAAFRESALLYDARIRPLTAREQALISAYEQLAVSLTVSDGERDWTGDALLQDRTLPFAAWYDLYQRYTEAFTEQAGELYHELVQTRNEIASTLGFSSYPAYRYAVYGRDCTLAEAEQMEEQAARVLAPLYRTLLRDTALDREVLSYAFSASADEELPKLKAALTAILPELEEPWDYMLSHELLDLSVRTGKRDGGFTTLFSTLGAPYLFTAWDDSFEMPSTLLHEFGHYAGYYYRWERGDASGGSLDLAEIDSQGLELLTIGQYDKLFENRADEAKAVRLVDTLYAILSGCAVDAFERYAYAHPTATTEQLCTRFQSECERFGLDALGLAASDWTRIPHIFSTPCYYVSYAISGIVALELYGRSMTDPKGAARAYRTLMLRESSARFGKMLQLLDLTAPWADGTMEYIESILSNQ